MFLSAQWLSYCSKLGTVATYLEFFEKAHSPDLSRIHRCIVSLRIRGRAPRCSTGKIFQGVLVWRFRKIGIFSRDSRGAGCFPGAAVSERQWFNVVDFFRIYLLPFCTGPGQPWNLSQEDILAFSGHRTIRGGFILNAGVVVALFFTGRSVIQARDILPDWRVFFSLPGLYPL